MTVEPAVFVDPTAIAVGNAIVTAKEQARLAGHDISRQTIFVFQSIEDDQKMYWNIEFSPIPPPGLTMRGGGFMVEINDNDGSVRRALFTQ